MPSTWLVRADHGGRLAPEFLAQGLVAIGWVDALDTTALQARDAFFQRMAEVYPDASRATLANYCGQLFRFMREIQVGDHVVTYDNARRKYLVGKIRSEA